MDEIKDEQKNNRIDGSNRAEETGTGPADSGGEEEAGVQAEDSERPSAIPREEDGSTAAGGNLEETAFHLSPPTSEETGVLPIARPPVERKSQIREFCRQLAASGQWRRNLLVMVTVLVVLALIPLAAYGWEGYRLQQMAAAGEVEGLASFIRHHEGSWLERPHLMQAIDSLARIHSPGANSFLEGLIFSRAPLGLRRKATQALAVNRVRVTDLARLYSYYKRNQGSAWREDLIALLRVQPSPDLFRMVEQDLVAQLDQNNYDLSAILAMMKELMPEQSNQIRAAAGGYLRKRLAILAEAKDMDGMRGLLLAVRGKGLLDESGCRQLLAILDSYRSNQSEIGRLDSGIGDLNQQIDSLKKQLSGLSYISLHGFVAGEIGDKIYAFALPGGSFMGLEFPSENYALLQVVNPNFSGKGWFTVNARRLDQIPDQVLKKHGNLSQGWPFYQEVPANEIDSYRQIDGKLSALSRQGQELTTQRQQIAVKNGQLLNQIQEMIAGKL